MTKPTFCRRCGGQMKPGLALVTTFTAGSPNFPGVTYSAEGLCDRLISTGKIVPCMKCPNCGHSVTGGEREDALLRAMLWAECKPKEAEEPDELLRAIIDDDIVREEKL